MCKHCHVRVEQVRNSRRVLKERNRWDFVDQGDGFTGWTHKFAVGAADFTLYAYCNLLRPVAEPQGAADDVCKRGDQ